MKLHAHVACIIMRCARCVHEGVRRGAYVTGDAAFTAIIFDYTKVFIKLYSI